MKEQEPWIKFDGSGRSFAAFTKFQLLSDLPIDSGNMSPSKNSVEPKLNTRTSALLKVPDQFTSIQNAVDAARSGDVILVREGVYYESVVVVNKEDIEIRGEGPNSTRLRSRLPQSCLKINSSDHIKVSNITFEFAGKETFFKSAYEILEEGSDSGMEKLQELAAAPFLCTGSGNKDVVLEKCAINGLNNLNGIGIQGTGLRISECEIQKCYYGVKLCGNDEKTEAIIDSNKIFKPIGNAITICCQARVRVLNNRCSGGLYGISAGGGVTEITGNSCEGSSFSGIEVEAQEGDESISREHPIRISRNRVSECGSGFVVSGVLESEIWDNSATNNELYGIEVYDGAVCLLSDNTCKGNGFCGIVCYGAKTKPSIKDNICNSNGTYGIWVEKSTVCGEFSGNVTSGNGDGGVERNGTMD